VATSIDRHRTRLIVVGAKPRRRQPAWLNSGRACAEALHDKIFRQVISNFQTGSR
jgi:hypothetical protein